MGPEIGPGFSNRRLQLRARIDGVIDDTYEDLLRILVQSLPIPIGD